MDAWQPERDQHSSGEVQGYRVVEVCYWGSPRDRHHQNQPGKLQAERFGRRNAWNGWENDGKEEWSTETFSLEISDTSECGLTLHIDQWQFDQRQKAAGKPSSDDLKKAEALKRFQAQVISGALWKIYFWYLSLKVTFFFVLLRLCYIAPRNGFQVRERSLKRENKCTSLINYNNIDFSSILYLVL